MYAVQVQCIIFWRIYVGHCRRPAIFLEWKRRFIDALEAHWISHYSRWTRNDDGQRRLPAKWNVNRAWWMPKICDDGQCHGNQNPIKTQWLGIKLESYLEWWQCHQTLVMQCTRKRAAIAVKPQHQVTNESFFWCTKISIDSMTFQIVWISDSMYQSSTTSQDGLAEAIQLLSCRPSRAYQPTLGQSFVEEQPSRSVRMQIQLNAFSTNNLLN